MSQQRQPFPNPADTLRVAVVDDEQPARLRLLKMLDAIPNATCVAEAADGRAAIEQVSAQRPDVVLMDIRMPGLDGLQTASALAKLEHPPAVIFCTAYDEHALAAFNANAIGYLLKPIKREHLQTALNKASQLNAAQLKAIALSGDNATTDLGHRNAGNGSVSPVPQHFIVARTNRGEERIAIDDICAFTADQKYVSAHLKRTERDQSKGLPGREILIDQSLRALEQQWAAQFIRVHRNALVAKQSVVRIENVPLVESSSVSNNPMAESDTDGNSANNAVRVVLANSEIAPVVSRRHLADIRRLFKGG